MSNLIKFAKVLPRKVHFRARPHHFHRINHRHFCSLFHLMQYAAAMIFGETSPAGIFRRNVAIPTYPAPPLYRKFPEFLRKIEPRHKMLLEIPQLFSPDKSVWRLHFVTTLLCLISKAVLVYLNTSLVSAFHKIVIIIHIIVII